MNETEAADSSQSQTGEAEAFGQALLEARKSNNLTVEEVAKAINLSVDIVDAIEKSDNSRLPGPAFVQGYLRIYAKHVGVSEEQVVDLYNKAVPHAREATVKPRVAVERELSLRTPLVLGLSIVLIASGLITLGYGIYNYYTEKAESIDIASEKTELPERTEESYILPVERKITTDVDGGQDTQSGMENAETNGPVQDTSDDQQPVESDEQAELFATVDKVLRETEPDSVAEQQPGEAVNINKQLESFETPEVIGSAQVETQPIAPGNDEIQLISTSDSWVEISDKNGVILFYDLMPSGKPVRLKGTAPFDVFLGNAPAVQLKVNGSEINMDEYIRSNNIAHYRITTEGGRPVFVD